MSNSTYSRNGDQGITQMPTDPATEVSKDDLAIEFFGVLEELNAYLGLLKAKLTLDSPALSEVVDIQRGLYALGQSSAENCLIGQHQIQQLEQWIDEKLGLLPSHSEAILPGGDKTAAHAHVCRAICRRAERTAVALHKRTPLAEVMLTYLNRLSDYFLLLARRINQRQGVCDNTITLNTEKDQD